MANILRIDASARTNGSHSRELGDHFEQLWLKKFPADHVVHRDVVKEPVPHIADQTTAGFYTPADQHSAELKSATALSDKLIAELKAADTLLINAPIYNFSVPSALKAYVDQIVRIGHTFSYDDSTFTGRVTGKRAFVICAYGVAGYGGPLAPFDHLRTYLNLLLNFLGISNVHFVSLEATTADEATVSRNKEQAKREIEAAVAAA